ncbi:hypothetical protein [Desulfosporosinus sp. BG]|uniref:hypothetical protein n=1 Tax=Desulfosporosinus sp. BG TaxID=1633135 RepID=UPI00083A5389|nr:hypothetical protein [Desulfosporosinus sp. BG]ODA42359.1 hypothetical protein DSBG_0746 [Desulfosporosinus sp. BG]
MFSKPEKNYFINISLIVMSLVCIVTGFLLDSRSNLFNVNTLHIWSGYIMAGILVIHLLMHIGWIVNLTKTIVHHKMKLIAAVATLLVSVGLCYSLAVFSPQRNAHGFHGEGGRSFPTNQVDQSN